MKTSNLRLALLALSLATLSSAASAQLYVGGGVGTSKVTGLSGTTALTATTNGTFTGDKNQTSWKLYGGYQFTPTWGLEAQYANLGNRSVPFTFSGAVVGTGALSARAQQFSLAATGTLPISNNFYLMGKLGASRNSIGTVSASAGGATITSNGSNKTDLLAGVGVGYNFNKNWGARVEYENFGKFSSNGGINGNAIKADNLSISVKYAF